MSLWTDIRHAARGLRRSLGFAAIAIVTLALSIGANTAVFSVARGVLLRPLPVQDADRVIFVETSADNYTYTHSFPAYRDFRDRNTTFDGLAGYRLSAMALGDKDGARRLWGNLATGNYFELLGVQPVVGRFFSPRDETGPDSAPFAVLSYDLWQSAFGGDPMIPGRVIRLNDRAYTVLGVAPRGFYGTEAFLRPQIWVPMVMQPHIEGRNWLEQRATSNTLIVGRLRAGVSRDAAEADLTNINGALAKEHPQTDVGRPIRLARPGLFGSLFRGPGAAFAAGVMLLAALVLLAACANLGGLHAARVIDRTREVGVRVALGASRLRVLRQTAAEVLLLTCAGGAVGLVLAQLALAALDRWRAPLGLPVAFDVSADPAVFAFAIAVTVGAAGLASAVAARSAWRVDPLIATAEHPALRFGGRRWSSRELLLAGQVALCAVLLTSSVVAVRGLAAAASTPLGIRPDGAAVLIVDLGLAGYSREQILAFDDRLLDEARAIPGVIEAAIGSSLPLSTDWSSTNVYPASIAEPQLNDAIEAIHLQVTPEYLSAIGTRLIAGRDFSRADDRRVGSVAIVNETFARRVIGPGSAIGRHFRTNGRLIEVVGIVEDGKYTSLHADAQPVLFRPRTQLESNNAVLVLRSGLPVENTLAQARRIIARIDPRVPLLGQGTFRDAIALAFLPAQAASVALGVFGVLAIVLAVVGVYGVAAYTVSARRREIGIRVAIGAQSADVLRVVLGRTSMAIATGSIAGLLLGIAAGQLLASVVYQATPRDPAVIASVALLLIFVGVGAACAPARRALAIDPAQTLKQG